MLGPRPNRLRTRMRYTRYKRPPPPKTTLAAATMLVVGVVSLQVSLEHPHWTESATIVMQCRRLRTHNSNNCASSAWLARWGGMSGIGITGILAHVERR